jgi:hypothetical protein
MDTATTNSNTTLSTPSTPSTNDSVDSVQSIDSTVAMDSAPSIEGDKTNITNFRDLLNDEYKENKSLESYKDINSFVKSHLELTKMLGDRVKVPGENATEEELSKFYTKLGRPETADQYELTEYTDLPEGFTLNEDEIKEYRDLAFKLGLNNKQVNLLRDWQVNQVINSYKSNYKTTDQINEDFEQKSQKKFGDKSAQAVEVATKLLSENLPEDSQKFISELSNDQLLTVIEFANKMSSKYVKADSVSNNYTAVSSVADRKNELRNLIAERNKMTSFDPKFKQIDDKIRKMYDEGITAY